MVFEKNKTKIRTFLEKAREEWIELSIEKSLRKIKVLEKSVLCNERLDVRTS